MGWQLRRGLFNPLDHERPGSPWWRAVNERLLRDTCEARLRLLGHPGPASSSSVEPSVRFARQPSPRRWYLAHNVTIVRAYLDHRDLAESENRVERFFINLVLIRVLYAHALVAAPRLALAWLAPIARWLGDPRLDITRMFLSVSRVLPHQYPLEGELDDYIADEHPFGRVLDLGVIAPRLTELYRWSADELRIPDLTDLVCDATPAYAWRSPRPGTLDATADTARSRRAPRTPVTTEQPCLNVSWGRFSLQPGVRLLAVGLPRCP